MKTFDLHQDLLLHMEHPEYFSGAPQTSWDLLAAAEVTGLIATAFPVPENDDWFDPSLNADITRDFETYNQYVAESDEWTTVRTADDLDSVKRRLILHIEGLNSLPDAVLDEALLASWYELGWRSLGIVWNKTNALGGGTNESGGLTELGESLMEWCLARNMILDCAHANAETFAGMSRVLKKHGRPILVSHGNAAAVCPSVRNYSDEQIVAIADSGGVMGVFCSGAFVAADPAENTLDAIVRHLEHIRTVGGEDMLAIGTDFGGVTKGVPAGFESIDKLPALYARLRETGWSDELIEKMAHKNAERVIRNFLSGEI